MLRLEYLIILLLSTFFLILFIKNKNKIGNFLGVLDIPKKGKIHKEITPLIGSFPILVISLTILIYFNFIDKNQDTFYILIYSYLFFIMGYFDDRYGLNAYVKLATSVIITLIAVNSFEYFVIEKIYLQSLNKIIFLDKIKYFFTILCVLLLINALNLMDGINGLASGFASLLLLLLSLISNSEHMFVLLFTISIFMFMNTFQIIKGSYFLGDSGTLFLGCLIGFSTIYIYNKLIIAGNFIPVEKIFIFFMIPGIDMFRLFLTRLLKKKDPFSRDLNHLHHLMLNIFSLYKTLIIYLSVFLITNFLSYYNVVNTLIIIFFYLAVYIFFIFFSKKKFQETPG